MDLIKQEMQITLETILKKYLLIMLLSICTCSKVSTLGLKRRNLNLSGPLEYLLHCINPKEAVR